jgi:hypothetical protein
LPAEYGLQDSVGERREVVERDRKGTREKDRREGNTGNALVARDASKLFFSSEFSGGSGLLFSFTCHHFLKVKKICTLI